MKHLILVAVILGLLSSCDKKTADGDMKTIAVNLDDADNVIIDEQNIVWLETNDSSLMYDISNLLPMDERYVVHSRSSVKIFDKGGRYLGEMTRKGQGPSEFLWLGNVWTDDSVFYLADKEIRKIQKYNKEGKYIGFEPFGKEFYSFSGEAFFKPEELYRGKTGNAYYVNTFLGSGDNAYAVAYSKNGSEPVLLHGLKRRDGNTFYNRVAVDPNEDRALYWDHVKDTVFLCTPDTVRPYIYLDYGKYAVPHEVAAMKDSFRRIRELERMKEEDGDENEYAYVNRYFQFHDGDIYYLVAKGENIYIVRIDEKKEKAYPVKISSPTGTSIEPQLFFKIDGADFLVSVMDKSNPENNPGLARISINPNK